MSVLRIGSLFSGIGGLELGVEWATGGKTVWNCETDEFCRKVLAKHWPDATQYLDVRDIDEQVEEVEILCGGFPCFPAGTLITTSQGLVPIEEIQQGDRVLTHKRRWRTVVSTMQRTQAPLWELVAFGAPPVLTTAEHPFYARRKRRAWNNRRRRYDYFWEPPEWVAASQLTKEHYLAQPVAMPSTKVPRWVTPAMAYLIGRWLGDGWIVDYKRKSKIQGRRGSRVNSWIRKVILCANAKEAPGLCRRISGAGLHATPAPDRTVTRFHITSASLVEKFRPFGRKAHGKRMASWVPSLPRAQATQLLEGWLDADGSRKGCVVRGDSVSRSLILGIADLMRRVYRRAPGVHLRTPKKWGLIEGRVIRQRPSYGVRLSSRNHQAFYEDGFMWVPVRKIEKTPRRARVFNLEVEEDESYVADSFVVHNCTDISVAGKRAGLRGKQSGLWHEFARIIRLLRPGYVFVENVPALRTLVSNDGLGGVLGDLAESGYDAEWDCVPAMAVGAPHIRDRIFILAWKRDLADAAGGGRGPRGRFDVGDGAAAEPGHVARQAREDPAPVDHPNDAGREERRRAFSVEPQGPRSQRHGGEGPGGRSHEFPPPPGSDRWSKWLALHPAAQPGIRRGPDGTPARVDEHRRRRLKALGNAVVPQAAARAWGILAARAASYVAP